MRKTMILATCALGALVGPTVLSPAMASQCIKPTAPLVVDKNSLTLDQRNAMVAKVDAYIAAMNVYLACLEASDSVARAEAEAIIKAFEAPVADLEIVQ